jgi:hypothetical protein
MNIYTYYQSIYHQDANEQNLWLMDVWKKSWRYYGWNPVVLTFDDIKNHSLYDKFYTKCYTYPTVNCKKYEMVCFMRWLSMFDKTGWITDYDVINYGFEPIDHQQDIVSLTGAMFGTIHGPSSLYKQIIDVILNYTVDETTDFIEINDKKVAHVSDMTILQKCLKPSRSYILETAYGAEGYETSQLVHYGNYHIIKMNTTRKNAIESDARYKSFTSIKMSTTPLAPISQGGLLPSKI